MCPPEPRRFFDGRTRGRAPTFIESVIQLVAPLAAPLWKEKETHQLEDKDKWGKAAQTIPKWMRSGQGAPPVLFLDLRDRRADLDDPAVIELIGGALREMQEESAQGIITGPAIIKTHIGEPKITTSIIPRLAESSVAFLKSRGVNNMAFGDSTVLYSSRRGGRENPHGSEKPYLELARERGWAVLSAPFVILDRPATSAPGMFEFREGAISLEAGAPGRFPFVHAAGAISAAKSFIQHAHMTGHNLTGLACCIKGIAMGVANRRGKAQMHLSLRPRFSAELCTACGNCAEVCPEEALDMESGQTPTLNDERCLGCGQCLAECEEKAIEMKGLDKYEGYDWSRGSASIHSRMVDYAIGLMQGLWDSMLHIAHLVRITPSCDCWNARQTPMSDDIGFLVGRNPFAVDRIASELLIERVSRFADEDMQRKINAMRISDIFAYAEKTYGISSQAEIKAIQLK